MLKCQSGVTPGPQESTAKYSSYLLLSLMKPPSSLPIPEKYAFDDTPKAFKRMMQRKNSNPSDFKKSKTEEPVSASVVKRTSSFDQPASSNAKIIKSTSASASQTSTKYTPTASSLAAGFKTIRSKRKAHLQSRDLKKKLKRFDSQAEHFLPQSALSRDVRDVVQEPPKLHQPKKTFKRVKDDREELKSWSDLEDELEEEE